MSLARWAVLLIALAAPTVVVAVEGEGMLEEMESVLDDAPGAPLQ